VKESSHIIGDDIRLRSDGECSDVSLVNALECVGDQHNPEA
jgi:hypothetical protein